VSTSQARNGVRAPQARRSSPLPESIILTRRSRVVGSDDLTSICSSLKWLEMEFGPNGEHPVPKAEFQRLGLVAQGVIAGLEAAIAASRQDDMEAAAAAAGRTLYGLKRQPRLARLQVVCRDGQRRGVGQIIEWYIKTRLQFLERIQAAKAAEAAAKAAGPVVITTPRRPKAAHTQQARKVG
jgi:hypothetical protein